MNIFRYIIAKYKFQENSIPPINIGVIIQSDSDIRCKFIDDTSSIEKTGNSNLPDKLLFKNLEKTLINRFSEGTISITDKETREKQEINYTDPRYLEYLNTNFLNTYIFEDKGVIQAEKIDEALVNLYRNYVNPNLQLANRQSV